MFIGCTFFTVENNGVMTCTLHTMIRKLFIVQQKSINTQNIYYCSSMSEKQYHSCHNKNRKHSVTVVKLLMYIKIRLMVSLVQQSHGSKFKSIQLLKVLWILCIYKYIEVQAATAVHESNKSQTTTTVNSFKTLYKLRL